MRSVGSGTGFRNHILKNLKAKQTKPWFLFKNQFPEIFLETPSPNFYSYYKLEKEKMNLSKLFFNII